MTKISYGILLAFLSLGLGATARAATIDVNSQADVIDGTDNQCTLREAITAANSDTASGDLLSYPGECAAGGGADIINIPAGTYLLSGAAGDNANLSGDLDIYSPLTLQGAGAANTIIDGGNNDRVAQFYGGMEEAVIGVTIAHGKAAGDNGGGLIASSHLRLVDCIVTANSADVMGGALEVGADTVIENSTISNNQGFIGGGIVVDGTVTLTMKNSIVSGNGTTGVGGGIFNAGGAVANISGSSISGNTALAGSGGIQNGGTLVLTDSLVNGNSATGTTASGGGIAGNGTFDITNSTISGNWSNFYGGGISLAGGSMTLTNVTITDNTADKDANGGGLENGGGVDLNSAPPITVNVRNSIIAGNHDGIPAPGVDCWGNFTSQGHNLIGNADGSTGFNQTGDQAGTAASPIDPKLGLLFDNGGLTKTHALAFDSPAVDAGDSSVCVGDLLTDQRGQARYGACDIGAYEFAGTCGDNVLQVSAGEVCDDGNTLDGDGCSAACLTEIPASPAPDQPQDQPQDSGGGASSGTTSGDTGGGNVDNGGDSSGTTDSPASNSAPGGCSLVR